MNVVDSSGWIEYVVDGPNAAVFAEPLGDHANLIVPSIAVFEVYRYVLRERDRTTALSVVASMRQGLVVALDDAGAVEAAELSVALRLPLADSIIYSIARRYEAALWTQDADFAELDGVKFVPKPSAR